MFGKSKQVLELENKINELESNYLTLQEECKKYKQTISSFVGVKTDYQNEVAEIKKKHSQEVEQLKNNLEIERKSVARKVNKALAYLGVMEFAPDEISRSSEDSPANIYNKFLGMDEGEEKRKYFKKHEKLLTNLVRNNIYGNRS